MGRLAEQPTESVESEQARVAYQPKKTPIQARADGSPVLPTPERASPAPPAEAGADGDSLDEGIRSGASSLCAGPVRRRRGSSRRGGNRGRGEADLGEEPRRREGERRKKGLSSRWRRGNEFVRESIHPSVSVFIRGKKRRKAASLRWHCWETKQKVHHANTYSKVYFRSKRLFSIALAKLRRFGTWWCFSFGRKK
jgi:hypothetical protein